MKTAIKFTEQDLKNADAIREAFRAYNNAGLGFEAVELDKEDEAYGKHVCTVDRFTDSMLRVYKRGSMDTFVTIVGDVNGPWAVRFKLDEDEYNF